MLLRVEVSWAYRAIKDDRFVRVEVGERRQF